MGRVRRRAAQDRHRQDPALPAQELALAEPQSAGFLARLKRDLGTVESYAAMIGMLVGAGIFKVTGEASGFTGPGVILAYLLLAPAVFATSIGYVIFVSTPLGKEPGGEFAHLTATFGAGRTAFLCAWLKMISYIGALAYLAGALADYSLQLVASFQPSVATDALRTPLALAGMVFFLVVHVTGVRWFGRLQVGMCAILGLSIVVLVVPGLFAIEASNYEPFLPGGTSGLLAALPPLFFAYAAFEALAHTAGEVKDSTKRLPRVFLRGIAATTLIFVAMSVVAFGVLPYRVLGASEAPMAAAAAVYLPRGATELVTIGGILAVATSLNATLLVPARLGLVLARDRLLPRWLGIVEVNRGTPIPGLLATFVIAATLLLSGQTRMALNIAVLALLLVYTLNSLALLRLPARNPELYRAVTASVSLRTQRIAAVFSILAMGTLVVVQLAHDVEIIGSGNPLERFQAQSSTSLELLLLWSGVGLLLYRKSSAVRA